MLQNGRSGLPCWPVSHRDGIYQVTDSEGVLYPITLGRRPVADFNPGWRPVGLQTGLPPFHLLELRNEDQPDPDAVWYLSEELDYLVNTPRQFSPEQTASLVSGLSPLLRDIYERTLCAAQPEVAPSSHAFDGINPRFVRELIGFVVGAALTPPEVVAAHRLDGASAHYMANGVRLSASLLRHCLDVALPEPARDALEHGQLDHALLERGKSSFTSRLGSQSDSNQTDAALTVASPFDATLLFAQEHFASGDGAGMQAYRFRDPVGHLTFYLLFQPQGGKALYIPVINTAFTTQDGLSGAEVMTALLSHYATHTDRAVPAEAPAPAAPEEPAAPAMDAASPERPAPGPPHDAAPSPGIREAPVQDRPEPRPTAEVPPANWWKRLFGLGS